MQNRRVCKPGMIKDVERLQAQYVQRIHLLLRENYFCSVFEGSSKDYDAINRSILEGEMVKFKRELSDIDNFTEFLICEFSNYVLANIKYILRDMDSELVSVIMFKIIYEDYLESDDEEARNKYNSMRRSILALKYVREETLQVWEKKVREEHGGKVQTRG